MRFKFRAWSKNNRKWYDRVLCGCDSQGHDAVCHLVYSEDHGDWVNFDEHCGTVVQWTGLKDKNGVDVYDGDFIHVLEVSDSKDLEYVSQVEFIDSGYVVTEPSGTQVPLALFHSGHNSYPLFEIEVVGNIYENPELIGR